MKGTEEELRLHAENVDLRRLLAQAGIDAAEQQVVERLQSVVVQELHHRMKNMLATVMAITSQSLRTAETVEKGRHAIESRLVALGRAHDLLLEANWQSTRLAQILTTAIQPFDEVGAGRFFVQTSDIEVGVSAALPLALALNELCTNAVKYGALSERGGSIEITATVDEAAKQFSLKWVEGGGPTVPEPTRQGFGIRLIKESFVTQMGGAVRLVFNPLGVTCEIDVPLVAMKPPPPQPQTHAMVPPSLAK